MCELTNEQSVFEQSFALYSKLAHTRACAAFMAPPWIWCKDHFVWCCIITWTDLQFCLLPFSLWEFCHVHLLGCSKYLPELSPLCNASFAVLDPLAEANGPLPLDRYGRYCASFSCASNLYNSLYTLHARHAIQLQYQEGIIGVFIHSFIHSHQTFILCALLQHEK